jgi:Glycosyl transferases group 1
MKLIVSHLETARTYVTRELYFIQHDLITTHGWRHIESDALWHGAGTLENKLRSAFGELPETVIFWEAYELIYRYAWEMQRLKCRKFFFADDLHWWDRRMREIKVVVFALSDVILTTYAYCWSKLYPELSYKRVEWIPHSASPDFMLSLNRCPKNSIFLSGAINEAYPLRQRMLKLHGEGSYAIEYLRHPGYYCGYNYESDANIGRGYAQRIHGARAGFADSVFPHAYLVAKYFEIPATGALLLADDSVSPYLAKLGFEANRDYVPVSQKNLEEQIRYVLAENNHEELDRVRLNGQILVQQQHKSSDRARRINEVCSA